MSDDNSLADGLISAEEIAETLTISAGTFSRVLRAGLKDAVLEGARLDDVLRRAALSISASALSAGLRPLTNLVGGGASAVMGGLTRALTGGFSTAPAKVVPFAEGGVIGAPQTFAMSGGRVGLMGEAGREAILPLARGTDGRLGVAVEGSGAAGGANVTINVTTQDADSFRRSEAQVTALLARAVGRGQRGL